MFSYMDDSCYMHVLGARRELQALTPAGNKLENNIAVQFFKTLEDMHDP